jgi:RNA polymerase sigma factor (sigma-70 family)
MIDDAALLRRYAEGKAEEAFAEIVRRHVNFVYACAVRRVGGDAHLAEDVTQQVFTTVAREAATLARREVLSGWLYTTARNAAAQVVRGERRRVARDQEAQIMNELTATAAHDAEWARLRPVIDEALDDLREEDREAVLLRFFEGKSFGEIGAKLRLSENSARMRVERALDMLHGRLARRGVTSTAAALGAVLAGQASVAAPVGLAASVTSGALAGAVGMGAAGAVGVGVAGAWMMKRAGLGMVAVVSVGVGLWMAEGRAQAELREEIAVLRREGGEVERLAVENKGLARTRAEAAALRRDDEELARLRDEVAELKERLGRKLAAERAAVPMASISGMIRLPGKYAFQQVGTMTLAELLAKAGGMTALANPQKIRVLRRQADGATKIFVKDAEGDGGFGIEPGDLVYVAEKTL